MDRTCQVQSRGYDSAGRIVVVFVGGNAVQCATRQRKQRPPVVTPVCRDWDCMQQDRAAAISENLVREQ